MPHTKARLAGAAIGALMPALALAQAPPNPPYYAMDPSSPLTPRANSPVQQQVIQNYRTQLQLSQHSLAQQDPGGITPGSRAVTQQLNQFGGAPASSLAPSAAPALPEPALNSVPGR